VTAGQRKSNSGKAPELYAVAADLAKASITWNQGTDSDQLADLAVKALQESVAAGFKMVLAQFKRFC
jgi:hypothetical protein